MSAQRVLAGVVVLFFTSLVVETCSGQLLFRRRREALKTEMKQELQRHLDANLQDEVETVRTDLNKSATLQVQREAAKIRKSLKNEILAMREEADLIVAQEKARITKQAAVEIAKIKSDMNKKIRNVKKELKVSTADGLAAAEDNLKQALENFSEMLVDQNKRTFAGFQKKTSRKFDDLKAQMVDLINDDVAKQVQQALKTRIADQNRALEKKVNTMINTALAKKSGKNRSDREKRKGKPEKKAMLNRIPRVTEEVADGGDA
ncbi:MAG: hypothetical protein VX438_14405 [Planctomycetota bacterium]|nr:hypothetical protein [Planctomycetota bacterium]